MLAKALKKQSALHTDKFTHGICIKLSFFDGYDSRKMSLSNMLFHFAMTADQVPIAGVRKIADEGHTCVGLYLFHRNKHKSTRREREYVADIVRHAINKTYVSFTGEITLILLHGFEILFDAEYICFIWDTFCQSKPRLTSTIAQSRPQRHWYIHEYLSVPTGQ